MVVSWVAVTTSGHTKVRNSLCDEEATPNGENTETSRQCHLPGRICSGADPLHSVLEGTIQAQELRPVFHHAGASRSMMGN